jgi:hypothetical protein
MLTVLQCDKVRPECSQCVRVKVSCSGYRDLQDLIFRDETKAIQQRIGTQTPQQTGPVVSYAIHDRLGRIFSNRIETYDFGPLSPIPVTRPTCYALLSPQHHILHTDAPLSQTVGLTTLDPFDTQLKSKLPGADRLLHHCMQLTSFVCT